MTSEREWGCYPRGARSRDRTARSHRRRAGGARHPLAVGRRPTGADAPPHGRARAAEHGSADGGAFVLSDPRLERLLGGPDLAWVRERVRRRLAFGQPLTGPITLNGADENQRLASARLLGRRAGSGARLTVRLEAVDETLRRSGVCPDGLGAAIVALTGPVDDRAAATARLRSSWDEAFAPVEMTAAGCRAR